MFSTYLVIPIQYMCYLLLKIHFEFQDYSIDRQIKTFPIQIKLTNLLVQLGPMSYVLIIFKLSRFSLILWLKNFLWQSFFQYIYLFLLDYTCFTVLCYFLLYRKVNQLYIYICLLSTFSMYLQLYVLLLCPTSF